MSTEDSSTTKMPFSMPEFSGISLPSLDAPPAAAEVEEETAVAPASDASTLASDAANVVGSGIKQLVALLMSALTTLLQLLLAKIQLAAIRQLRSAQAYVDAQVARAEAAPAKALAAAKRAIYVTPFYARAAVELAYEGALAKVGASADEVQRRVDDAPRYFSERLTAAKDAALAAPDKLAQEVAATVKAQLDSAQASVDGALEQAKSQADSLRK